MRICSFFLALSFPVQALTIRVDYRFDTQGFFDAPGAKESIEAAAARWSRIIDQTLLPVNLEDDAMNDARFGLFHPETGNFIQVSAAASADSDFLVLAGAPAADIYLGGFTLEKDVWILFVGSRALTGGADAIGGPLGIGINTTDVDNIGDSFINRGFNVGVNSLGVLGGSIVFDTNTNWNFDLQNPSPAGGAVDFYSLALHEIGHGLGLSSRSSPEWEAFSSNGQYEGPMAIAAHNRDNQSQLTALELEDASGRDFHWKTGVHQSKVFQFGSPNTIGVIADGGLQTLLMDAGLTFSTNFPRLEVTNIEVGGLQDVGWSVITEDPPQPPRVPLVFGRSESGVISLEIPSEVGVIYTIQTSDDAQNWMDVTPSLDGNGQNLSWEDGQEGFTDPLGPAANLEGKFYRVITD